MKLVLALKWRAQLGYKWREVAPYNQGAISSYVVWSKYQLSPRRTYYCQLIVANMPNIATSNFLDLYLLSRESFWINSTGISGYFLATCTSVFLASWVLRFLGNRFICMGHPVPDLDLVWYIQTIFAMPSDRFHTIALLPVYFLLTKRRLEVSFMFVTYFNTTIHDPDSPVEGSKLLRQ